MATINLTAPQANQTQVIQLSKQDSQINFNFDTSDALFEKVDNNLEIYLSETDSTIVLEDFYLSYSSDNLPNFLLSGDIISSQDFFAALDSSLMPAAGNENTSEALRETRFGSDDSTDDLSDATSALNDKLEGGSEYSAQNFQAEFASSGIQTSEAVVNANISTPGASLPSTPDSGPDSGPDSSPDSSLPPVVTPDIPATTPELGGDPVVSIPTPPPTAAALVNDFVSLNAGASATGNLLAGEDSTYDGATITSFEPAEGWSIIQWTDGTFMLTYDDNPDFRVLVKPDGSYTFTTPEYEHGMDEIDINSILKYTIEDVNGDEHEATVTFASNATSEENLLIDGDFTEHTITITNVGSQDQNSYEYTTAGYEKGGQDSGEKALSGLFLGSNDDKVEVTGTLGKGTDGVSHHIYGDELQNYEDAGNDTIIVGEVASGGNIRADGNLYNDVVGGDDLVEVGTVQSNAVITADGWHLYSGSQGGNDVVNIENVKGGIVSGDAYELYTNAQGGDDTISVDTYSGKSGSYITGDAYTLNSGAVGGNDQINITEMSGQSVYGDANVFKGIGGNDNINVGTMNSGSITGDGSTAYSTSQAGNDTITVDTMNNGAIYGDSWTEHSGAKSGSDSITVETMNGGNIYADGKEGTKDDGGNDTVTVNEFGTGKSTIDGGLGEDTFTYGTSEDTYIDFSGTSIKIAGTNATITNFENLNTGAGDDFIKVSSETLDSLINTGEGFDIVYTDDADMSELLASNNMSEVEMFLTGDGITSTSQDALFEELGIAREDGTLSLDSTWSYVDAENGGSIYSNGTNEIWINSDSNADDSGLDAFTWKSTDLLGGTDIVTDFQEGDKLDLTELKDAGYDVSASNGENGEGILTITDAAGQTAQTIIIPDVKFDDDELSNAENIAFINM